MTENVPMGIEYGNHTQISVGEGESPQFDNGTAALVDHLETNEGSHRLERE
jgi:hypothetical protein